MSKTVSQVIFRNTVYLYIRMFITLIVSLYTSRIVLQALGVQDFGIYNLINGLVLSFSFLSNALISTTQRFYSTHIGRNDKKELSRSFGMSINIMMVFSIVIFLSVILVGKWMIDNKLNIPFDRIESSNYLLYISLCTFVLNLLRIPYNSILISFEKMSFYAYTSILESVSKLLIVYLLTLANSDKLVLYGILLFLTTLVLNFVYYLYVRLRLGIKYKYIYDPKLGKELLSFSSWNMFGGISNMVATEGMTFLINIFYGVTLNASFAIAKQVNSSLMMFVSNFQTAFYARINILYASSNWNLLFRVIKDTSVLSLLLYLLILPPFLINTEYVLYLWLGYVPEYSSSFIKLLVISSLFEAISGPFWITIHATGKIKKYQLTCGLLLMLNLPMSYLLLQSKLEPYYMLIGYSFIYALIYLYRLYYLKVEIHFPVWQYLKSDVLKIVPLIAIHCLFYFFYLTIEHQGLRLIFVVCISTIITLLYFFMIVLSDNNKKLVLNFFRIHGKTKSHF